MLRIGMFLGDRYEISERIGSGGMSDVYKAKDHKLNRNVAVKVLKQEYNSDKNFVDKFQTEAQSAAGLTHPNIVNVYDVGEETNLHYIVMELVEGITLKKYIEKKGHLEVKETIGIAVQVSQGIEAAHAQHIVHRDIKPQNIIISREGKVKVTDFGIAKAASSQTISSNAMGSVHYISPEQARGGYCDERSDVYSLGITMYEMITGKVPYEGDSTVSIALQHIQGEIPSPKESNPKIPVSLEKIILKCTQKKPEMRYPSISALIQDLKRALVTPNEDFVRIMPAVNTISATRVMSEAEVNKIQRETSKISSSSVKAARAAKPSKTVKEAQDAYLRGEESELDEEDYDSDEYYDDDYDDENYEEYDRYSDRNTDGKFEKILLGVGIGVAALIIILAIYAIGNFFDLFGGSSSSSGSVVLTQEADEGEKSTVSMPNVVGKDLQEAMAQLDLLNIRYRILNEDAGAAYKENEIVRQDVAEGTPVDANTTVTIYFNTAVSVVKIPDGLVGKPFVEVSDALTKLGLLPQREYTYSDTVENGYVISVDPASGTEVSKSSFVKLVISRGSEAENTKSSTVEVPDVVGYSLTNAREELENSGLRVSVVEQESERVSAGYVISQNYAYNEVEKGTTITLWVSSGPPQTQPPTTTPVETTEETTSEPLTMNPPDFIDNPTTEPPTDSTTEPDTEPITETAAEEPVTEHVHSWSLVDSLEPSCTGSGMNTYTCDGCGATYEEEVPALGHHYEETGRIPSTYDTEGYITYTCSRCGYSYNETLPMLDPPDPPVTQAPEPIVTQEPVTQEPEPVEPEPVTDAEPPVENGDGGENGGAEGGE